MRYFLMLTLRIQIKRLRAGLYTYIFISPKLASTPSFYNLLKDPKFKKQLALVIINKAYLIIQQGKKFCPKYTQLYYIRNLIGSLVLQFAYSTTLDLKTLEMVKKSLGFNNTNIHLKQTSISYRELIFYRSQILKDIITKYTLLRFLLNKAINPAVFQGGSRLATPYKIPKTIIFFNTKV